MDDKDSIPKNQYDSGVTITAHGVLLQQAHYIFKQLSINSDKISYEYDEDYQVSKVYAEHLNEIDNIKIVMMWEKQGKLATHGSFRISSPISIQYFLALNCSETEPFRLLRDILAADDIREDETGENLSTHINNLWRANVLG